MYIHADHFETNSYQSLVKNLMVNIAGSPCMYGSYIAHTGFEKRYPFHTQNLTHFLNLKLHIFLIMACNCLKFSMNVATVSGYILIL